MRLFKTFAIPLVALVALSAVGHAADRVREHRAEPWLLLVSHRIDVAREATWMFSARERAEVRLLNGPRFVINLTSGLLVDSDGHVLTRLVNLDPFGRDHDLKVTTATGAVYDATFVGLDQPSGLALLSVPELKGTQPVPPPEQTKALAVGAPVRIVTAQYQFPQVRIAAVERIALYPKLVIGDARIASEPSAAAAHARRACARGFAVSRLFFRSQPARARRRSSDRSRPVHVGRPR